MDGWRFGVFQLDLAAGELWKSGRRVRLGGQPLKALALLVSRAGEVVTRDDLRRHLWPEGVYVEFDASLNFSVRQLRAALGDDARTPRFIETLPRRGYRFLAPVERVQDAAAAPAEAAEAPAPPRPARSRARVAAAAAITALLLLRSGGPVLSAHSRTTAAPAALAEFQRGLDDYEHGSDGQRRSVRRFQAAVRIDPRFAEAHYALADTYFTLGERGVLAAGAALPAARAAAERAAALEEAPMTRLILATVRYTYDFDWDGAAAEFERALALAPDSDVILAAYARFLSARGRDAEAVRAIDRAEALAPNCDLVAHESGWIRLRARRFDEAVRKFGDAIRLGPPGGWDASAWARDNTLAVLFAHARRGDWVAAAQDARAIRRLSGVPEERLRALDALPPRESVQRLLRASVGFMSRHAEQEPVPPVRLAQLNAALGEREAALDWLERAAGAHDPTLAWSLRDPVFDALRDSVRFRRLARRAGLLPSA